jgi:hypothetical protein
MACDGHETLSDPHTYESFGRAIIAEAVKSAKKQLREGVKADNGQIRVSAGEFVVHFGDQDEPGIGRRDPCCCCYAAGDIFICKGSCCSIVL